MFKSIQILTCVLITLTSISQTFETKEKIAKKVFDDIVHAYGNSKSSPKLILLRNNQDIRVGAIYKNDEEPKIIIDEQLVDICLKLKKDSLNALSTVIGHELSHYFNDHSFCGEYSFAMRKNSLGISLSKISKTTQIEKETQADYEGLIYAAIAGYYPFNVFERIIDKIYLEYKLPNTIPGYPTLNERKEINKERWEKVKTLLPLFEIGNNLIYVGQYENAAIIFKYLLQYFPSREIYNNLGTAQLLIGLKKRTKPAIDYIYPIEIDPFSRLQNKDTRSNIVNYNELNLNFESAKEAFNKAIQIDPYYIKAKINLSCLYDIVGNYNMSIGIINDLPDVYKNDQAILTILGICYDHLGESKLAEQTFLKINDSLNYNFVLNKLKRKNFVEAIKYQLDYKNVNAKLNNIRLIYDSLRNNQVVGISDKNPKIIFKNLLKVENKFNIKYSLDSNQFNVLFASNKEININKFKIYKNKFNLDLFVSIKHNEIININETVFCKINESFIEFIEIKNK